MYACSYLIATCSRSGLRRSNEIKSELWKKKGFYADQAKMIPRINSVCIWRWTQWHWCWTEVIKCAESEADTRSKSAQFWALTAHTFTTYTHIGEPWPAAWIAQHQSNYHLCPLLQPHKVATWGLEVAVAVSSRWKKWGITPLRRPWTKAPTLISMLAGSMLRVSGKYWSLNIIIYVAGLGAWLIHIVLISFGKIVIDTIPKMTQQISWTLVNLCYLSVCSIISCHCWSHADCAPSALLLNVSLGHRHAIWQRTARRRLRWFNTMGANWWWSAIYSCKEMAAVCAYYVVRVLFNVKTWFCLNGYQDSSHQHITRITTHGYLLST